MQIFRVTDILHHVWLQHRSTGSSGVSNALRLVCAAPEVIFMRSCCSSLMPTQIWITIFTLSQTDSTN